MRAISRLRGLEARLNEAALRRTLSRAWCRLQWGNDKVFCTLRVLNPAIRFLPPPKTFLLHRATYYHNHLPSAFSSFSNCSRSFLLNPKRIEFA